LRPLNALRLAAFLVCFFSLTGVAAAAPLLYIAPSIGPDPFLSTSFDLYSADALWALQHNLSSFGVVGPGYYSQLGGFFTPNEVIGTNFYSWLGQAPPPPLYASEYGNMLYYGLVIYGNGTQFTLSDITFNDDFYGNIGPTELLANVAFGARLIGINYGPDGVPGGGDDTIYNGTVAIGTPSTLLDALYFSGFGDQFYVAGQGSLAANQTALADAIAEINNACCAYSTGTYTLTLGGHAFVIEGTLNTPEPGTVALVGLGLALAGVFRKRLK